jgi:hypothetical protein
VPHLQHKEVNQEYLSYRKGQREASTARFQMNVSQSLITTAFGLKMLSVRKITSGFWAF